MRGIDRCAMTQNKTKRPARPMSRWLKRWVRYPLEALVLWLAFALLGALPTDAASNIGGWIGRTLGPRLRGDRIARVNLKLAMPELGEDQIAAILNGMWDNLGRTLAEYPHLRQICRLDSGRVELQGRSHVEALLSGERSGIILSAHLANWEIMPRYSINAGLPLMAVVRPPNNPLVARIIDRCRGEYDRVAKEADSARQMMTTLREGGTVGLLADQKFNRGVDIALFGQPSQTTDAPAQLALRTGSLVVPAQLQRQGPGRFKLICHAPIDSPGDEEDRAARAKTIMAEYHRRLEDWVRERPAEWLWIHRRWPKELYRKTG